MAAKNALLVFIKTPKINFVKTRLATHLQPDEILSVYTAFLKDIDKKFQYLTDCDLWYVISPENLDLKLLGRTVNLNNYFIQQGNDLGDRMCHAFNYSKQLGYDKSVLIGSDSPDIPVSYISETIKLLEQSDSVFGPTLDGGYYLVGMKKCHPELFQNIEWSTERVLDQTVIQAKKHEIGFTFIRKHNDIDTFEDLRIFAKQLKQMDKSSIDFPLHTWQILEHYNFDI